MWGETEEAIAIFGRKDEDVWPENGWWAGFCAVDEIKLNRILADNFVNSFHWNKG